MASQHPDAPVIEVRQVSVAFDKRPVLTDVNLEARRGEVLTIMGPSGCGKTTLLKCMSGLLKPDFGNVLVGGDDITRMSERRLNTVRRRLGLVFQYAALFDYLTVEENVAFGLTRHKRMSAAELKEVVADKLSRVGLAGSETLYPSQLSGGMRKRVGLARALALDPEALLYDEPTSGLDPVTAYAVDSLIVEMADKLGVTSVVVSHDVNSVMRVSDRVVMLAGGAITAEGSVEEMRSSRVPQVMAFLRSAEATSLRAADESRPNA